jgi:hypothetical protein
MKRIGFFTIVIIITGIFFNACYESTLSDKYYYEVFTIYKADYYSVPMHSYTYESIASYRYALRNHAIKFLGSGTDATYKDIYELLTQHGCSPLEAKDEIFLIDSIGNNLFVFTEYDGNPDIFLIMYCAREL